MYLFDPSLEHVYKSTVSKIKYQTDRRADRQLDGQTYTRTDRQTDSICQSENFPLELIISLEMLKTKGGSLAYLWVHEGFNGDRVLE